MPGVGQGRIGRPQSPGLPEGVSFFVARNALCLSGGIQGGCNDRGVTRIQGIGSVKEGGDKDDVMGWRTWVEGMLENERTSGDDGTGETLIGE